MFFLRYYGFHQRQFFVSIMEQHVLKCRQKYSELIFPKSESFIHAKVYLVSYTVAMILAIKNYFLFFSLDSHFTTSNECIYICHMKNEDRRTLLTNISSMTRDEKKTLEINRGSGSIGKEFIKLAGWKDECTRYFACYYKSVDIITVPSDRDTIMTTLYGLCSRNAGKGFIFKNYDMISHLEFLGYDKKLLAKNLRTRLTTSFTTYLAYIEQKKVILICGKLANSYNTNQCVENIVTSIKCFLTLYGEIIQNELTVIGIMIRENEEEDKTIRCKFCKLFSTSHKAFESTDNFISWWKPIENFHNWWDLDGSQRVSICPDDRNKSLFDILAAEILGFMAAAMIPTIPSLTKDVIQQLRQTYLLYTPEQMNAYFSDNKHVIIQGSYGSGKSILGLKKLELIWKNFTKNEIIFYVNYDNKSQLHTQMEINVREVLRTVSRNVQFISSFGEISKLRDSTVYVWQNEAGENLSTIMEKFTNAENLKMVKVNVIVEEYDGETLTQNEAAHIKKLIKTANFKESHVIILQQPLTKKRSWSVGKDSYERESYLFQELEGPFKVIKLEKTLRCTNEIYNLTKFTQNLVENNGSVFPTDIDKLKPPPKQTSINVESTESTIPSKENVCSDPNKIGEPLEQDLDLDHTFKNLSALQNRNGGKSKIVSNFGFVCEPRKGLDITKKTPKLIEFSEQINSTSNIAVIALTLALNEFVFENKKTTLLYTSDKEPKILRMAIHLFPHIISKVYKIESLEEYEVRYTESLEEYLKNKETRMVFVSNFRSVNGMEFDNVLILLNRLEYYLKHFLPQMISRCNCNLNFILLPKGKEFVKRRSSWAKLSNFLLRSKSVEEKFTVGNMIEEWKRESLVKSCEWDYKIIECQIQTCKEEGKCYSISNETDDLFTVHSEYYGNHLSVHNENLEGNEQTVDTCGFAEGR